LKNKKMNHNQPLERGFKRLKKKMQHWVLFFFWVKYLISTCGKAQN
jgi:hypothetical protein